MSAICGISQASGVSSARPARGVDWCMERIQKISKTLKDMIPPPREAEIRCPITCEVLKDPVVTNCRHIFERSALDSWRAQRLWSGENQTCPYCVGVITSVSAPESSFCNWVRELRQEERVPTLDHFEGSNEKLARENISLAKGYVEERKFPEALKAYSEAFKYTAFSEDYEAIFQIYIQLGELKKAMLSTLYLTQYQLQEGKVDQAIITLSRMENTSVDVSAPMLLLELLQPHSLGMLNEAMARAETLRNSEDKIAIYSEIIAIDPFRFEAHEQLISLTQDPAMRKELCLQAAAKACQIGNIELEAIFHRQADRPMVLTRDMWIHGQNLPPRSAELEAWLDAPCPFEPGRTRRETHIVFPIFPHVSLEDNAPSVPLNFGTLDQLDKNTQGPGYRWTPNYIPLDIGAREEFCWGVLYHDVIPNSRHRLFENQVQLLPEGYEVPGVYEAVLGILWEQRRTGTRCFSDNPSTQTYCRETVNGGYRLGVGGFSPDGCILSSTGTDIHGGRDDTGLGALRKFL
ncbi:MAG TPA: hypothetical protein VJK48_04675 [Chlamydiales bacterium]|nr:hypothetical protein [Chlamydiales bacterium]